MVGAARQDGAGLQRQGIGQPLGIAEGDNPGVFQHQKVQYRPQEGGLACPARQIRQAGPGRSQKDGKQLFLGREPPEGLKSDSLGGILPHVCDTPLSQIAFPCWGKGFVNHSLARLTRTVAQVKRSRHGMAERILIVDETATNRILLKVRLAEASYDTALAKCCDAGLRALRDGAPDLVLLDIGAERDRGLSLLRRMRAEPAGRDLPILASVAPGGEADRLAALQAGADDLVVKPVDQAWLLARLRGLLRARSATRDLQGRGPVSPAPGFAEGTEDFDQPGRVALVADRPETALRWRKMLAPRMPDRMVPVLRDDVLAGLAGNAAHAPDTYLLEASTTADLRLVSDLQSRADSRHSPVFVMLPGGEAKQSPELAAMAFDLGASGVLDPTCGAEEIALRLRRAIRQKRRDDTARARLRDDLRLAHLDPLTGLHNRRYAMDELARLERARTAGGTGLAVMVVDIDRFKSVNDAHGHPIGDRVLVEVAQRLKAELRPCDLCARIGGEEFLVALPDRSPAEARAIAERLRQAIPARPVPLASGGAITVTVSIGLAFGEGPLPRSPLDTPGSVFDRADGALREAKARGRNLVTVCRAAA